MIRVHSAIYGNYDFGLDIPWDLREGQHYFHMATDNLELWNLKGWITDLESLPTIHTPMMKAKYWKTANPAYLMEDGDVFIWIDGSLKIIRPDFIGLCENALGRGDAAFMRHPDRDCIYDEADFSLLFPRYQGCGIETQVLSYKACKHPEHWGLIATTMFVMRITHWTRRLLANWWEHCNWYSHQDQLSLPFLLRLCPPRWNMNIPFGEWYERVEHIVK